MCLMVTTVLHRLPVFGDTGGSESIFAGVAPSLGPLGPDPGTSSKWPCLKLAADSLQLASSMLSGAAALASSKSLGSSSAAGIRAATDASDTAGPQCDATVPQAKSSDIDFDYVAYADQRLQEYRRLIAQAGH